MAVDRALDGASLATWRRAFTGRAWTLRPAALTPFGDAGALSVAIALLGQPTLPALSYALLVMLALRLSEMSHLQINPRVGAEFPWLLGRLAVPAVLVAPLAGPGALDGFVRLVPLSVALVLCFRGLIYAGVRAARRRGLVVDPTLIVGAGALGAQIAATLVDHEEYGLLPLGFVDDTSEAGLALPVLGGVGELPSLIAATGATRVIVAFGATREPELVSVLRACSALAVEVHVVPRFFELGAWPEGPWTDQVGKIPILGVRRGAWRGPARRAKRCFDVAVALVGLVVAAPVMAACALAVLISSGRPVLFRQKRVGEGGRVFELLKFRTFPVDNDSATHWSTPEERCNRVQKLLRHTSLDELPQLVNVLRKDMSLVGPRPERPQWVAKFEVEVPRYEDRHRVPGGMTGWAQIHGLRGDTSMIDRARFDNFYIENWSPWRDLAIVFRTPKALKGSRR